MIKLGRSFLPALFFCIGGTVFIISFWRHPIGSLWTFLSMLVSIFVCYLVHLRVNKTLKEWYDDYTMNRIQYCGFAAATISGAFLSYYSRKFYRNHKCHLLEDKNTTSIIGTGLCMVWSLLLSCVANCFLKTVPKREPYREPQTLEQLPTVSIISQPCSSYEATNLISQSNQPQLDKPKKVTIIPIEVEVIVCNNQEARKT